MLISLRSEGRNRVSRAGVLGTEEKVIVDMVTNYPQRLTATTTGMDETQAAGSVMNRAIARVGQMFCGLRGHDSVLHFEGKRVMMRCTSCGHDSPGWEVSGRAPRQKFEGDSRRHVLVPQRLVLRKTA